MKHAKYIKTIRPHREMIHQAHYTSDTAGLRQLKNKTKADAREIIFRGSDRPKWLSIIFNIARLIAHIVAFLEADSTLEQLKKEKKKSSGPMTKDGYLQ